jgi:ATP-dependent Clp endopeptidase proteolytic subunit ClpP
MSSGVSHDKNGVSVAVANFVRDRLITARPVAKLREGRTDWYRITNQAGKAEIYIYDEIGYFGVSASDFVEEMKNIDATEIDLHINSPGGEVFDGFAIYSTLKQHSATITTYIDALAASAASFIAMAGDKIIATKQARLMIHNARGIVIGESTDMRSTADQLDALSDTISEIYADKTGGTKESFRKMMNETTWFSAQQAKETGLVDEIQGQSDTENKWDLTIFGQVVPEIPAPTPEPPVVKPTEIDGEALARLFQAAIGGAAK